MAAQLYSEMGNMLAKLGNHNLAAEFTAQSAFLRQRDCMNYFYRFILSFIFYSTHNRGTFMV